MYFCFIIYLPYPFFLWMSLLKFFVSKYLFRSFEHLHIFGDSCCQLLSTFLHHTFIYEDLELLQDINYVPSIVSTEGTCSIELL